MTGDERNTTAWPIGDLWPDEYLFDPVIKLAVDHRELEVLMASHEEIAAEERGNGDLVTETYHLARASYLRQRLAEIAPHRLQPQTGGNA